MKHLLKLMTVALLAVACGGKKENPVPEKPVVTPEMYAVTCISEKGEVTFEFLKDELSPFWSVTDPAGQKLTFTDRKVTKTYKANGKYTGSIMAYGAGGQSEPVGFEFEVNTPEPEDKDVAAVKSALSGKTFQTAKFGWWGEGWEYFDDPVPEYTADDKITFKADGTLVINQGETAHIYNDGVTDGEDYTVSGTPRWGVFKEKDVVYIQFSDGGFPLMLAGKSGAAAGDPTYHFGLNAKWTVASVEDGVVRVEIYQDFNEQWLTVFLSPAA